MQLSLGLLLEPLLPTWVETFFPRLLLSFLLRALRMFTASPEEKWGQTMLHMACEQSLAESRETLIQMEEARRKVSSRLQDLGLQRLDTACSLPFPSALEFVSITMICAKQSATI